MLVHEGRIALIKLDLITGFLGSGKTTFIKAYARYLMEKGEKICIIENDFGAINVDMVLLKELESDRCNLEMIVGGDGAVAHKRRLKTKLISMGMLGYDRVIIEPSGIYDVDEFFDLTYEEPLDRWYETGNVITIINPKQELQMSTKSRYILMSEVADSGIVIMSRSEEATEDEKNAIINLINGAMEEFSCSYQLSEDKILDKPINSFGNEDFERITKSGYHKNSFVKNPIDQDNDYQTLFFFDYEMDRDELAKKISQIFADKTCGNVHRIKGIIRTSSDDGYEINSTSYEIKVNEVHVERPVLIIIGEELSKENIAKYLGEPTL